MRHDLDRLFGRRGEGRALGRATRPAGRVALWVVVGLLLVRGAEGVLSAPGERPATVPVDQAGPGKAAEATATEFARAWLEDPYPKVLSPFLADGVNIGTGKAPTGSGRVAQAEVIHSLQLGGGRWLLTVSCDLRGARVVYLAVPVARPEAGEAAVIGAPSIVAVPAAAGADPERPLPLAGPDAGAIRELVAHFVPAYLASASGRELSYLLAPGTVVVPLAGQVELVSIGKVEQVGDDEGPRRWLIAAARIRDPGSGAVYPAAWRLRVAEHAGRWYVAAVEGAVA